MTMKQKTFLTLLPSFFLLGACSSSKYLEKPADTNLSFWITEKVESSSFEEFTFLPGGFGVNMYLDKRYELEDQENPLSIPPFHVIYHVTKYPDYSDKDSYVTFIEITDPSIYVYGLSTDSNQEDISSRMEKEGFQEKQGVFLQNNCSFSFSKESILISANVSNRNNISF